MNAWKLSADFYRPRGTRGSNSSSSN